MSVRLPISDWVDFSNLTTDESDTQSAAGDDLDPLQPTERRLMTSEDPADPNRRCSFSTALLALTEDIGGDAMRDDSCWLVDCEESDAGRCPGSAGVRLNDPAATAGYQTDGEELQLFNIVRKSPNHALQSSSTATSSLSSSQSTGGEPAVRSRRPPYLHRHSSLNAPLDHDGPRRTTLDQGGPRRCSEPLQSGGGGRVARCLSMPTTAPSTSRSQLRHLPERTVRRIHTHYYPEGGWGWCVLGCASVLHAVPAGLQPGYGSLCGMVMQRFVIAGTEPVTPTQLAMTGQYRSRLNCGLHT